MKRKITFLLSIMMLLSLTINVYGAEAIKETSNINCNSEIKEDDISASFICIFHDWHNQEDGDSYKRYTKNEKKHCYDLYQNYKGVCLNCGKNRTTKEIIDKGDHDWKVVEVGTGLAVKCQICGLHKDGW